MRKKYDTTGTYRKGREKGPAKCELWVRTAKALLRTLLADNSSLIPKVACAWSGSPQPFRQMFCWRNLCWPKQLLLGQGGAAGGEELSSTLHPAWENTRYSNISSCASLPGAFLNSAEGWTPPHPRGQQSPCGRLCLFQIRLFFSRPGETTGTSVKAPRFRRKGEKKIIYNSPLSSLLCLVLVVIF